MTLTCAWCKDNVTFTITVARNSYGICEIEATCTACGGQQGFRTDPSRDLTSGRD